MFERFKSLNQLHPLQLTNTNTCICTLIASSVYPVVSCRAFALICFYRLPAALRPSAFALVRASGLFPGLFLSYSHKGYRHPVSYSHTADNFISLCAPGRLLRSASLHRPGSQFCGCLEAVYIDG